jgi:hypothetical protein
MADFMLIKLIMDGFHLGQLDPRQISDQFWMNLV